MTPIPNATSLFFEPANSGNYAAEVTKDGCTIVSDCFNFTIVGINESLNTEEDIQIYPTITHNYLQINIDPSVQVKSIELIDAAGQIEMTENIDNSLNNKLEFDLSQGIYFILFKANDKIIDQQRFIVQ